jgi:hypothetical protein
VARSTAKGSGGRRKPSRDEPLRSALDVADSGERDDAADPGPAGLETQPRRNGGWREIEALREKAALKASLADVWDDDFDLDEEILAELDHTAEFFTTEEEPEEEVFDDDDVDGDYFDDEDET